MKSANWYPNPKLRRDVVWASGRALTIYLAFLLFGVFFVRPVLGVELNDSTMALLIMLGFLGAISICILDRLTMLWYELRDVTWLIRAITIDEAGDDQEQPQHPDVVLGPPWENIKRLRRLLGFGPRETSGV